MCKDADGNDLIVVDNPYFTYTGWCEVVDDLDGNWRIIFLISFEFKFNFNILIDVFLVGGGGCSLANGGSGILIIRNKR